MDTTKKYVKGTLCLPIKILRGEARMLLAKKTRTIGVDRYNGPGGGLEPNETLRECVIRESLKELGITIVPRALEHVAVIDFYNRRDDNSVFRARVWTYISHGWRGKFRASDEMIAPALFSVADLPFGQMMAADRYWIPEVLFEGRKLLCEFHYGLRQAYLERPPIMIDLPEEMEDN